VKDLVLHFSEEMGDVSLENVKECEFLGNFPKVRPRQYPLSISKQAGRNLE